MIKNLLCQAALLLILLFCPSSAFAQNIQTVVGNGIQGYSGDGGPALSAEINNPLCVTIDAAGNMYIPDIVNNKIRKVSTSGIITCIAGTGNSGSGGDGGQATSASLYGPHGVTFDASGNMYIPDYYNHKIRKVDQSGIITTVAGTGTAGFSGDGGLATAANLNSPTSVAFDAAGNMYISDCINNRIRMVTPAGLISTFAGNGVMAYGGDGGQATGASLSLPCGIVIDSKDNLYIADDINHCIRKVDATGTISTVVGTGVSGHSGDGGAATAAKLHYPTYVNFDTHGNMYITDEGENTIRMVSASGIISTLAGNGSPGFGGDGGPASAAILNIPDGIAFDPSGNLYFADGGNNRIRKITLNTGIAALTEDNGVQIWPNPADKLLSVSTAAGHGPIQASIYDLSGKLLLSETYDSGFVFSLDVNFFPAGFYILKVITPDLLIAVKKVCVLH